MFEKDDFVQVKHTMRKDGGDVVEYWVPAIYMGANNGNHCVVYSNGSCQELHKGVELRKAN